MKLLKNGLLFVLLALLLVLAACSGGSDEASSDDSNQSDGTSDEKNESDSGQASGGDLQYAANVQPPSIDPVITTATATRDVGRHIFETLVTLDSEYQVIPMLADSWEISDDGLIYTFKLREGVLFHNGQEMKAEDVVASMTRWQEKSSTAQSLIGGATFEEVDEYTLNLVLDEPSVFTLSALGGSLQFPAIMPKDIVEAATETGVEEFVGTGPFKFVEWKTDQYIHLAKYEDYAPVDFEADGLGGKKEALVDNIYINFVTDPNTQLTGIQTAQYDIGYGFNYDMIDQLNNTEDVEATVPFVGQYALIFNKTKGVFSDQKMRQAIAYGLDLETVANAALNGHYRMSSSYMQEEQVAWASDAGSEKYNNPDLDKAKDLLEEAGYNGEPIRFITTREYSYMYDSAVVMQEQLEKIGINVELEVYDWPTVVNKRSDPEQWELFITGFPVTMTPVEQLFFNDSWFDGPEDEKTVELLKAISAADTQEEAKTHWDELQGHSWELLPVLKISDYTTVIGLRSNVEGFGFMDGPILWNLSVNK